MVPGLVLNCWCSWFTCLHDSTAQLSYFRHRSIFEDLLFWFVLNQRFHINLHSSDDRPPLAARLSIPHRESELPPRRLQFRSGRRSGEQQGSDRELLQV